MNQHTRSNSKLTATLFSILVGAVSHRPAPEKYHAPAAPEGEILAVTVTITDKAGPRDRLVVPVATWSNTQYATDWVEFDIAFSSNTPKRHPWEALKPLGYVRAAFSFS